MAQFENYNMVWSFSHPDAAGPISTGLDYDLVSDGAGFDEFTIMEALNDAVVAQLELLYLPIISSDFILTQIDIFNHNQPTFGATFPLGTAGGSAGESVALRSAPVVSKRTELRGRSFRGRMFLMAPLEADQSNGVLTGTYRTEIDTFMATLLSVTDATTGLVFNANVWSETLLTSTQISSFLLRRTMGGQRKRQKAD